MSLLKRNINIKGSAFPLKCNIYPYSKFVFAFFSSTAYDDFKNNIIIKAQETRIIPNTWKFEINNTKNDNLFENVFKKTQLGLVFKPTSQISAIMLIPSFKFQIGGAKKWTEENDDKFRDFLDPATLFFFDIESQPKPFKLDNRYFDGTISKVQWTHLKSELSQDVYKFVIDYFNKHKNSDLIDFDLYIIAIYHFYLEYYKINLEHKPYPFDKAISSNIGAFVIITRDFETEIPLLKILTRGDTLLSNDSKENSWTGLRPCKSQKWYLAEEVDNDDPDDQDDTVDTFGSDVVFDGTISKEVYLNWVEEGEVDEQNGVSFVATFHTLKTLACYLKKNKLSDFDLYILTKETFNFKTGLKIKGQYLEGFTINDVVNLTEYCIPIFTCQSLVGGSFRQWEVNQDELNFFKKRFKIA